MNGSQLVQLQTVHAKGSRKITDEEAVVKACEDVGIDPYAPKKVAGITELTKRIGKAKFNDLIGSYISMQLGSLVLVPRTDPREEAVNIEEGEK